MTKPKYVQPIDDHWTDADEDDNGGPAVVWWITPVALVIMVSCLAGTVIMLLEMARAGF